VPDTPPVVVDVPPITQKNDKPLAVVSDIPLKTQKSDQPPARFYVVQKGDTLSAISSKYYGSPNQWPKIVAANRTILPDPDRLVPGARIIIPE
jgi:nucleoid-associated protein YgaU